MKVDMKALQDELESLHQETKRGHIDSRSRRWHVLAAASDYAGKLLYYDRRGDEDLALGQIEEAIAAGEVTVEEIAAVFELNLRKALGSLLPKEGTT